MIRLDGKTNFQNGYMSFENHNIFLKMIRANNSKSVRLIPTWQR